FALQCNPTTAGAIGQNVSARRASCLVTDEQDIVTGVPQHRFQIIYHSAARAHTGTCDHHAGAVGLGQVVHGVEVIFMGVNDRELLKGERMAPSFDQSAGLVVPVGFEIAVDFGELCSQGGINYDFEVVPGQGRRG